MEKLSGLSHLFITVFLYNFSTFMVVPAITDVTMSALCPGQDECSLTIYLCGIQQAITGLGTLVMMPLMGNLSDTYGRKVMLTLPMTLTIIPLGILAYSRTAGFFYAYFAISTLTSMFCGGSVACIALAYVADNIPENRRASAFGILSGISSCAFVCGNLFTRFISTPTAFQVATAMAMVSLVYMRIFLKESITELGVSTKATENDSLLDKGPTKNVRLFKILSLFQDTMSLLRSSSTFSQAAIVAFFTSLGEFGLYSALMFFLKAQFHFDKDQFADLMIINGVAGTISQMVLMPLLVPLIGEEKLLATGLFFSCIHIVLYSIAWSSWVAYAAAMFSALAVFGGPCLRSIVSKQIGPSEQGKAQGCIAGIASVANIVSPLVFSPLTALFLSDNAPFQFPGFSILCASFVVMIAFIQSIWMRAPPPISSCGISSNCVLV
ncbi:unnamed protein product [Ilex paraguariensis]|uniref:Major facilitator superfamily (MFS) profile domain-containing protein n=1 Tax=Ilex paraguariensis TaxID=185542 RepID=A0ABC8UE44_9AQUA